MSETILALLNRIAASSSIDDAWEVATAYFARLGFGRVNYGFTRFKHLKTIGDPEDALFLSTCVDAAVSLYFLTGVPPPNGTVCSQDVGPFDPAGKATRARALRSKALGEVRMPARR